MPLQKQVYDALAFTTEKLTWVSSGVTPGSISSALIDKNEVLISSTAGTSSGNGFYYAIMVHPGSACWVVNEWRATINGNLTIQRQFGRVRTMEVD